MPFNEERVAATYAKEILRFYAGTEIAENAVIDGSQVPLNADGRRIVETGQVMVYAGLPEVDHVVVNATGGTYTLTFGAQTTTAIAFDATPAVVQARLEALTSIGAGNVSVSGPNGQAAGGPYDIRFIGALGASDVGAITHTDTLTGTAPGVTITVSRQGVTPAVGQKVKPAPASGVTAAQVAGILMHTTELWPGVPSQDKDDEPVALWTTGCNFAIQQLLSYSGNAAAVNTALNPQGCTFK